MIERYLRLHLAANLDRPQTVRHSRDALRRLVHWLTSTHPEITNRDQLRRAHAEEFLRWFGEQTSQHTGVPLALTTRRSVITLLTRFVNETAAWHWTDVPGRVLFTRSDIPKIPRSLPRFIPDHELAALMNGSRPTARPLPAGSADRRPCECDLVLTCSKFLTTSNYAPRLHARLDDRFQEVSGRMRPMNA